MQLEIYLKLLKLIEKNPQLTQRELAHQLGISLGKTNYCLKALKEKGWLKGGEFSTNPNKFYYIHLLTPKGISEKIALTMHLLKRKEKECELLKEEIAHLHDELATSPLDTNPAAPELLQEHEPHSVVR